MLMQASRPQSQVSISGFSYSYQRWQPGDGHLGRLIAVDTETSRIVDNKIPTLSVMTASDGRRSLLVHPDDVGAFLLAHRDREIVCHNAAFDFWVIHQHLEDRQESDALNAWVRLVPERRLHDTMLLDMLIRMANGAGSEGGQHIKPRDLATIVGEYTGLEISKADPYRLRYGEIIGVDWEQVEAGFFEYAIKDSIVTHLTYQELRCLAAEIMAENGFRSDSTGSFDIYPDAPRRFGLLSEAIQVEGAIALSQISRYGMHTDQHHLAVAQQKHQEQLDSLAQRFAAEYLGILKLGSDGRVLLTPTGTPKQSTKSLEQQLLRCCEEIGRRTGVEVAIPRAERGGISKSLENWEHLISQHPFLKLWSEFQGVAKLFQFFRSLNKAVLRPTYSVMVSTGRTSCANPNVQQIPRGDSFRQIIVPSTGHLLLVVDYSYIELVTLAAVCQARFGYSRLGDIIRAGIDPHCHTAAMLLGVSLEEFMAWKESNNDHYKLSRQRAKGVNFGVPGGMGPEGLVGYARNVFGVVLSLDDAITFREKLTRKVYPELGEYLADTGFAGLATRLGVPETVCRDAFSIGNEDTRSTVIRNVIRGLPIKRDGTPYQSSFVQSQWDILNRLNRNPELTSLFARRQGSPELASRLMPDTAATLTGRIRGEVSYTQQRNTPFQSLASDGAKRALGRLVLAGYRVVGFVHDEMLIELPDEGGFVSQSKAETVVDIIRSSMQELTGDIPVSCEYSLSTCWSKSAKLICEGERLRPWKPIQK